MRIEQFQQLLRQKKQNYNIVARVPYTAAGTKRVRAVEVIYSPGGKVYTYKGDIVDIAHRLDLIEKVDPYDEALRVLDLFKSGQKEVIAHYCHDELRWEIKDMDFDINIENIGDDEFGRILYKYSRVDLV